MATHRDAGEHDYANTTTIPGPILRSRHVETEAVEPDPAGDAGGRVRRGSLNDDVRCPTCGRWLPGIAAACPDDGTPIPDLAGRD